MNQILAVAQKELKEILGVRSSLIMGAILSIFFALTYGLTTSRQTTLDSTLFLLAPILGFFMAYTFDTQVFLREKLDKVIETILCAPVSLSQILLGKVLAVSLVSHIITLVSMAVLIAVAGGRGHVALPGLAVTVHLILAVPVFIAAFSAVYGLLQFAFGIRENRFLGLIVFVPIFAALILLPSLVGRLTVTWAVVGLTLLGSLLLVALALYLSRFVSRERIVTTLS
jgi:ABC-2 type transport system permease protein